MSIRERLTLYRKLEQKRGRPLIVYVTSTREGSFGGISADVVPEIQDQLQALPKKTKALDLLLVSSGGDPTVAWRVVSLIRERVEKFSVLVPQAAFSAATLIVLGADEVVMHPNGNLGPTDPQITKAGKQPSETVRFGSEDLSAFLKFAKETVGLKEQPLIAQVFQRFCDEVGAVGVGVAARGALLSLALGEKLLQLHMKGDGKAKAIAEKLTKDFFHHGYPVNRSEATEIGLNVAKKDPDVEDLMWQIWTRTVRGCAGSGDSIPNDSRRRRKRAARLTVVAERAYLCESPARPYFKVSHIVDRQGWETVYPEPKQKPAKPAELAQPSPQQPESPPVAEG